MVLFCSFLIDNFSGDIHTHMLPGLGQNRSNLILVEDYARLERAVNSALRATLGPADAAALENQLLTRYSAPLKLPRPQALLLALREALPRVADSVLLRTGHLYASAPAPD